MSKPEIFDHPQGSPEWFQVRAGIPTMSKAAVILREKGKGADGSSLERAKYVRQIAGEVITGIPMETYSNHHMERGKEMEAEARAAYAFMSDIEPQIVGFVRRGKAGGSPDSLLSENGLLEIKTELPDLLIETLLKNDFPTKHIAQCQGNLWVTGRDYVDIAIYFTKMPLFVKRAYRDESYIRRLAAAVDQFNDEVAEMVDRVKRYRDDRPLQPGLRRDGATTMQTMTPKEQFLASVEGGEDERP